MDREPVFDLYRQATLWADQLRSDPFFTNSDAEELKGHLLDIVEELVGQGYCEEEAFAIAASRLGKPAELREEFGETNTPVIQLRKTILVLSGILSYFLFFFFVVASTRLLILALDNFSTNQVLNFRFVFSYVGFYFLLILAATLLIYFTNLEKIRTAEYRKIKPLYMYLLFVATFILALINKWLSHEIDGLSNRSDYTFYHQYILFDYLNYIAPLISIGCFIVLYNKFNGLKVTGSHELTMKSVLLVLSGILVYFFLRYFLHATARIFISALQYHVDDPELNIRRTWSYVASFQLLFVLIATALYFLDKNLVRRLKKLHFKPAHTIQLLFATIFLAIADRCFFPIASKMIDHHGNYFNRKYWDIFDISDLSFPFILGACFLVLFSKYYRENFRTCN